MLEVVEKAGELTVVFAETWFVEMLASIPIAAQAGAESTTPANNDKTTIGKIDRCSKMAKCLSLIFKFLSSIRLYLRSSDFDDAQVITITGWCCVVDGHIRAAEWCGAVLHLDPVGIPCRR